MGARNQLLSLFLRFLCVGGAATVFDTLLFAGLVYLFPAYGSLAFTASFITTVLIRFFIDKHFTFQDNQKNAPRQFLAYCTSCGLTLLIGLFLFQLGLYFGASPFWSKVLSIPFVMVSGFFLFRYVAFAKKSTE